VVLVLPGPTDSWRSYEHLFGSGVGHTPGWEDPGRFSSDPVTFARAVWPQVT
jgi:hypothetical protein